MRFSLVHLVVGVAVISVLCFWSFVAPRWLGFIFFNVLSLCVLPPILFGCAVGSRGSRQAFFVGCILAGLPNFALNMVLGCMTAYQVFEDWPAGDFNTVDDEITNVICSTAVIGYGLSLLGGCCGWLAFIWATRKPADPDGGDKV